MSKTNMFMIGSLQYLPKLSKLGDYIIILIASWQNWSLTEKETLLTGYHHLKENIKN